MEIEGEVHLDWEDRQGRPTGIAVAEPGGLRRGLIGPGYEKLEALALALAKVRPFKSIASPQFLRTEVFEWVKKRDRGQESAGCVDYVLRSLKSAVAEHRLLFPVSDLHVQSPLTLGLVTVSSFPERIFEELESKEAQNLSAEAHAEVCRSMRRDFQGLAVAETSVFGEPIQAQEIAAKRVDRAVGVLRFFTPPGITSRIARWGHVPPRTSRVFVTDSAGKLLSASEAIVDRPGAMVLGDELRDVLLAAGLAEICDILARTSRTDFEETVLVGMVTFGRAALTTDLREKMIWYCAGLESILLRDSSEPILQNLSERLVMCAYDTVQERAVALKDIREGYALRSRFVHHGAEIDEGEVVTRFAGHGLRAYHRIIKNVHRFNRKVDFVECVDRMKLSGESL